MFNLFGKIIDKISLRFGSEKTIVQTKRVTNIYAPQLTIITENYNKEEVQKITEKNMKKLGTEFQRIPEENITPWEPHKTLTAIQRLQCATDEQLSDMFIELLVKAADSNHSNKVKAGYQEILSALDPEDAALLEFIFKNKYTAMVPLKKVIVKRTLELGINKNVILDHIPDTIQSPVSGIPFLEVRNKSNTPSEGWYTVHEIFTDIEKLPVNKSIREIEGQLQHLSSLGLLEIKSNSWFLPIEIYDHFRK